MLSILEGGSRDAWRQNRRELLRIGGLTIGGLALPHLLAAERRPTLEAGLGSTFGRAKNVIFLFLAGGPPQHETFDPKPEAPVEIRGPFQPIQTNIPGVQFCELLPRIAQRADKLAVIRSMATDDHIHSSSGAWVLTGHKYLGPNARTQTPNDWPYFGSVVKMLRPSDVLPALSTVWIPDVMRLNGNVTPAGQTGGLMGSRWSPNVFVGDPSAPEYKIESLQADGIQSERLDRRRSLLREIESGRSLSDESPGSNLYEIYQQQAFDLLVSGRARTAFEISREPDPVRDRYGRNRWGQCLLLARRLIEAGVRLVHVQWPREPGDNAVDNPLWDTHAQNADRVEDVLCPMFDLGFSALLDDLDQRGLLEETLVVAIGEFGRTPKINNKGGRDHWGSVFSCALAGAGIRGGQVYGASDANGAFPLSQRVQPGDLTASIFHLLGIPYQGSFPDRVGREYRLTQGEPIHELLGTEPATRERAVCTADVSRVPPYDPDRSLAATNFAEGVALKPVDAPSRPKGWRAAPAILQPNEAGFGVRLVPGDESPRHAQPHAFLGMTNPAGAPPLTVASGTRILLAQEVRSPFAGMFRFSVRLMGDASSESFFQGTFLKHFSCRLLFLKYRSMDKRADQTDLLGAADVVPLFRPKEWQSVQLQRWFANPNPGQNFSFGAGLAVAIEIVQTSTRDVLCVDKQTNAFAGIRIADVSLDFTGKKRDENVKV